MRTVNGPHIQLKWHTVAAVAAVRPRPDSGDAPVLTLAVAKRLLKRAVDRNRFRRIAREAWRRRLAESDVSPTTATRSEPSMRVFIRLMRVPADWQTQPDGARKRAWRAEIDALLGAVRWPRGQRI